MTQESPMHIQENCVNSGRKFLFGGISLLQPSENDDCPPRDSETKMHLTRENSDSRSHSVFRKNSQKRRSPSFRTPPCEREMMKSLRFKKSALYSSTPDLCRPGGFPKSLHGDCGVGRPSVKQMIQNFEVVGSTVGNPDDRVVLPKVVDHSARKIKTLPLNSLLPSRSSPVRSSYLSNSFDTGFYSDSSCCEFEGTPESKKDVPGTIFDSSTSLCLLPTTLSSIYSLHQDNPLYGSLPRIKPTVTSRYSDYSRPAISTYVKESFVQLRRTRSINCESSEHMNSSKSESRVTKSRTTDAGGRAFVETQCKSVRATESVSSLQYSATGITDEEPSSAHLNGELSRRKSTTKRSEIPEKRSTKQTNGTFIARWVQVDDLNKDANADDDNSSINSTSTSNSQSSDSKQKGGRASGSKRDKRPERRESGRFTSAAKLLRSLSRAPREEPSDTLQRSNPHYHSEGKGLRKKNAWTSQRELSSSSAVHKERSHSFCDKAESKARRYPSSQEEKESQASTSNDQNFVGIGARVVADTRNSSVLTSESGPTRPPSSGELELEEPRPQERVLERDKDRRSIRKLTKDSGYETSPYSELSDYAHLEQLAADAASNNVDVESEDDGDDVTLAAESEPTSEVTPSTSPAANTPTLSRRNSREKSSASRTTSLPGSDSLLSGTLLPPAATERLLQHSSHALPLSPSSPTLIPDSALRLGSPQSRSESPHQQEGFHLSPLPSSSALPRCPSLSSLSSFAESLVNSPGRPSPNPSISHPSLLLENPSPSDHPSSSQHQHSHGNSNQQHSHSQQQQALLLPVSTTSSLEQQQKRQHAQSPRPSLPARNTSLVPGSLTRSTPNLDEAEDGNMVTKNSPMYSYMRNGSTSAAKGSSSKSSKMKSGRYWEGSNSSDTPDREDYAHHLRSSSYQVLHSQQQLNMGPSGPHHARQASNASHCSEPEDGALRADQRATNYSSQFYGPPNVDRSRYLSYDNIGSETPGHKYQTSWNVSEPNLSGTPPHSSQNSYYPPPHHLTTSHNSHSGYYHHHSEASSSLHSSPGVHHTSLNMQHSSSNLHSSPSNGSFNSQPQPPPPPVRQSPPAPRRKHPSSPPPLPVRDASSLKFLKYGPGHEKFPSWPVPAGNASQVMGTVSEHDSSASGLSESLTGPQGSHRSKSWTEQSDFPKDLSGGYTRPHHKKHLSPAYQQQLKTVLEKSEKIPPQLFESKLGDDLLSDPKCVLLDSIYKPDSSYYPLYDRDGHGIDDKDYNIPSPPERDPGMGEANLSQVTPAQLEEYSRHYDFSYGDVGVTPFLDRLREESAAWDGSSAAWDGGSERDSGRGESESMADSFRYSNGRESVTTVVTNSSSASSSETLKWHGSLSDISIMSGHSRDARTEQNIVHSSRVLAPQRQNSESVLYYSSDKGRKQCRGLPDYRTRDGVRISRENDPSFARGSRETRWNREVERNNEMNNLKKFPSYSYTQPLSQINEASGAESHETNVSNLSTKSPTIDISKPPSVAERIHELERQSRNPQRDQSQRFRDASEPRERTGSRDGSNAREVRRRDLSEPRGEYRDEQDNNIEGRSSYTEDLSRSATESNQSHFNGDPLEQRPDLRGDRSQSTIGISNESNLSSNPVSKVPIRNAADLPAQDQENLHSQYNHNEREKIAPLKNFAYLDPKKQCKVPDSTLKNIQKQALKAFYERRTGIKSTSASSLGSNKPPSPLVSKNSFSSSRSGSNIREDRSGLAGISLARLGRVPDSDCAESPSRPPRKRSVSGRSDLKEDGSLRPGGDSQRSSLVSNCSGSTTDTAQSAFGVCRQTSLPPAASPEPPPVPPPPALELRLGDDPPLDNSRPSNITRPPVLPPTALDESLPRPPERPPKKANLRSLFPSQKDHGGATGASINGEDLSKPGRPYYYRRPPAPDPPATPDELPTPEGCLLPPAVSESTSLTPDSLLNDDLHNPSSVLSSPGHRFQRGTYSHPASLTPCHLSLPSISQGIAAAAPPLSPTILALASQASRSSTPDLPPPPPPLPQVEPEAAVTIDEEPLPPPPTEVIRSNSRKITRSSEPPRSLDDLSYSMKSNSAVEEASGPPSLILFTEKHSLPSASEAIETSKTFRRRSRSPPPPPTTPPPPLTEVDENTQRQQQDDGTYHKDSYMAQKKDWKSGFEGRYRRTSSPSASPIRNSLPRGPNHPNAHSQPHHHLTHHSSTKCLNSYNSSANNNNNYSALSATSMLSSSTMALTSYPSNASSSGSSSLSSSLSSSSSKSKSGSHLKHSISSTSSSSSSSAGSATATPRQPLYNPRLKSIPLDNEDNVNNSCVKPAPLDNENHVNNNHSSPNGWPGHARQTSTTVNFTSEELRAFRSRRAAGEGYFQGGYRTLPSAVSTPALVQPSSYNSQTTSSNQGSSSSLASATIDTPPKTSPSTSLRASLDSLHCPRAPVSSRPRGSHEILPRTTSVNENISSGHDSMSRCLSAADSLSRSTSVAESLCRSSSVAETASSLSRTSSISESTAPSPTSLACGVLSADGLVIARPATVTEEQPMLPSSPEPRYSDHFEYSQTHTSSHDTYSLIQSSLVEEPASGAQSPDVVSSPQFPASINDESCASLALALESVATPDAITDSEMELEDPLALLTHQDLQPSSLIDTSASSTNSIVDPPQSPPALPSVPPPPLEPPSPPSPASSDVETVTIGYGRSRRPEELECEQLSMEYVARLGLDPRLQALLAPGPELKTTADYMEGVFTYKVRRDILASQALHLLPKSAPITSVDYHDPSSAAFLPPSGHTHLGSSNSSYSRIRDTDAIIHRLHSVPRLTSRNNDSTSNSSLINSNTSSLSNRFTTTTSSSSTLSPSHNHDALTSLTNSSSYSSSNVSIRPVSPRLSRSSSYLGASPVHLSSANQVANFTSLASPLRTEDGKSASSHFFASRSLSMGPEHPSAFGSSLSSLVVAEGLTNGDADIQNITNGETPCSSDVLRRKASDRSPLPSDSAYFTTSESKARLLTRLRSSPGDLGDSSGGSSPTSPGQADSQQTLLCKKEALMSSISRKLDILRAEREAIKEEVRLNRELGAGVTEQVQRLAKAQEIDKYLRHVEEIDKITSLLLGLSGRLARADNALLLLSDQDGQELRKNLMIKRARLKEQLDEAKTLKENIDRRALQVDKCLKQYLNDAEFADYDHFIKMKAKLVMDAREIADKIKLGEEQMTALRETFKSAEDASANK